VQGRKQGTLYNRLAALAARLSLNLRFGPLICGPDDWAMYGYISAAIYSNGVWGFAK
jgi:hypothetical protein